MSEIARILLLGLAIPAGVLLAGSVLLFLREKTLWSLLQLFGTGFLMVVVLTHVAETLRLFPSMHWGLPHKRWPLRRFVECGSGSHVVPLRIFPRCAYGATRRSLRTQAVQTPVNPRLRLYGKAGIRICGSAEGEGARSPRALSVSPLAECRRPVEYIVGGLLGLGGGGYHHALVATEFGEPALNIVG